jgi:hypothetical protein
LGVSSQPSVENKCDDVNIATRIMKSPLEYSQKIFFPAILYSKCTQFLRMLLVFLLEMSI